MTSIPSTSNESQSQEAPLEKLPEVIPILPVFDMALFPKMQLPIMVTEPALTQLVDEVMAKDRVLGIVVAKKADIKTPYNPEDIYTVGTAAPILKMAKAPINKTQMLIQIKSSIHQYEINVPWKKIQKFDFGNGKALLFADMTDTY